MSLIEVNTLINELVPDQSISKNSKKVGVYAGSFKPPTKGHFAVVQKALRDNPDLDELNIFVGTGVRDGVDQSQSMLIWDIYKKYLPFKVNIMPVSKPPIKAVYDYAKENQDEQVSWIIGAREGNEDDFKDIALRTKAADNYKNLVVRPTITQSGASGTAARNAYKVSQEKLEPLLPKNLNQQEKDDVFNILNRRLSENSSLIEGKYDSLVTKLAGFTLNAWKGDYNDKQRKGYFEVEVGPGKDFDYPHLDFTYKAQAIFDNNVKYRESGVAKPFVPEVVIKFVINSRELPEMWENISMDLRNIIRHEISHLMQAGPNVKAGKEMKSDQDKRKELESGKKPWWKIWRKKLGTPDYYKLEKEIDANLEGLYLKAKKSRQPLGKVIDDYLEFKLKLSPKDREDIKNLWRERAPKINIPLFEGKKKDPFGLNAYAMQLARGLEEQESEYKVYLDMDGVVADFDKRFEDLSGMKPREFEEKYGKSKFWDFIDEENKVSFWVGIPEMDGAKKLVDYVKKYNYELLTAPSVKKQSYLGKILWVRNHSDLLGGKPRINFKKAKEKHEVKSELTKNDILIDDRADTIGRWEAKGGTGIVYKSANQVINDLKKLGL